MRRKEPEGGIEVEFTNNQTWFTVLLVIHVFFAIAGIGPSFAFAVLGPFAAKNPEHAYAIVRGMNRIEKVVVAPTGWVIQWLSGTLLIFNRKLIRDNFWQEEWLVIAIVLYAIVLVLSYINIRVTHEMESKLAAGEGGTEAFGALAKKAATFGQSMTLLVVVIAVLMIWKPLSECAGPLLRC